MFWWFLRFCISTNFWIFVEFLSAEFGVETDIPTRNNFGVNSCRNVNYTALLYPLICIIRLVLIPGCSELHLAETEIQFWTLHSIHNWMLTDTNLKSYYWSLLCCWWHNEFYTSDVYVRWNIFCHNLVWVLDVKLETRFQLGGYFCRLHSDDTCLYSCKDSATT